MVSGIASGLDRQDGLGGRGGTPTNWNNVIVNYAGGITNISSIPLEEMDDSPTFEWAEQCTVTHKYRGNYQACINIGSIYQRGSLVQDSGNNLYRVLSCSVQYQKAGKSLLTIVTESVSFDCPPDEFSCNPTKIGLDIMKHPRYFSALMPTNQIPNFVGNGDTDDQAITKQTIIRSIQAYRENPLIPTSTNINNLTGLLHENIIAAHVSGKYVVSKVNPNYNTQYTATLPIDIGTAGGMPPAAATMNGQPNPPTYFYSVNSTETDPNQKIAMASAAAKEIIGKLWRMEDAPMINGLELTWSEYYFRPPPLNLGGYAEDPKLATPGLPDYFYSTAYPPDPAATIFDKLSSFNPQCFSTTGQFNGPVVISWLRDADTLDLQRTWFKQTRKWLGAVFGAWDADINSSGNRPKVPTDFRNLLM